MKSIGTDVQTKSPADSRFEPDDAAEVVLVTGASGFIGRRLCAELKSQGRRIRALHRKPTSGPWHEQLCLDLAVDAIPDGALQDVTSIYHLAGRAHAMDEIDAQHLHHCATVVATQSLLQACNPRTMRSLVFLSTSKAVAEPGDVVVDESFIAPPQTPYGQAKREAEAEVINWGKQHSLHVAVLRPPMVLGAGAKGNAIEMLRQVQRRRMPPLPEFGNRRSLVHVQDLVDALIHVSRCESAAGGCFFVADSRAYSTRELLDAMRLVCAVGVPAWSIPIGVLKCIAMLGDLGEKLLHRRLPLTTERLAKLAESAHYSSELLAQTTTFRCRRTLMEALCEMRDQRGQAPC